MKSQENTTNSEQYSGEMSVKENIPKVLDVKKCASILGISIDKMYEILHSKYAPPHCRVGGPRGRILLERDSFLQYIDNAVSQHLIL